MASARLIGTSSDSVSGSAKIGISTRNGTTARSWNSSTPSEMVPCGSRSSYCSVSSLTTIAVDDIVSAPPTANAACHDRPSHSATRIVLEVDTSTCTTPIRRTM